MPHKTKEIPILTSWQLYNCLWGWGKIEGPNDGCWLWKGAKQSDGYGIISINGGQFKVHRVVVVQLTGQQIPVGLTVDHVVARGCTSKLCCNPAHLEVVTQSVNTLRIPRKDVCKYGHKRIYRKDCSVCNRLKVAAFTEKNRVEVNRRRRELYRLRTEVLNDEKEVTGRG